MPELPEVETVRRGIEATFVGSRVASVEITGVRTVRRQPADELVMRATGSVFTRTGRRGKYLWVGLDDAEALVMHLRMSGQLLAVPASADRVAHTHAVFRFEGNPLELRFVDPRTFGELFVTGLDLPELVRLGVDPIADRVGPKALGRLLAGRSTNLKALLLDQGVIAGIGNIYADEILWRAALRPDRPARTLSDSEVAKLHRAIKAILTAAIDARGSSLADQQYRDLEGEAGNYQLSHRVHARAGQPCRRCGESIVKLIVAGRSSYLCPRCQY